MRNEHVFQLKKENICMCSIPGGIVGDTNMAAVPLFRDTNMALMMPCGNTL